MDMGNNNLVKNFFSIIHNRSFSDSRTLSRMCKELIGMMSYSLVLQHGMNGNRESIII